MLGKKVQVYGVEYGNKSVNIRGTGIVMEEYENGTYLIKLLDTGSEEDVFVIMEAKYVKVIA